MAKVMAGEVVALTPLVERHYNPLLGYLYRLTNGNRSLAEDLVQETFVQLLRQSSYRPERPFKPWLYTIATNLARDYFGSSSHKASSKEAEALPEIVDISPGPEELALAREKGQIVAEAISSLAEEYRATLLLRFYNGFSLQEIAETLTIPLGTVKSRLSVGTHQLRKLLKSYVFDNDEVKKV